MRTLLLIVLSLMVAACNPAPIPTASTDAQKLVDSIVYVKAKNGLCYGVATVERFSTNSYAINQMIVFVPCQSVGL